MRLLTIAALLALVSACGGGGAASPPTGSGPTRDTGTTMTGAPAAGKATMNATFSNPVNGYNGTVTPYAGLEDGSDCSTEGTGIKFNTYTANGSFRRDNVFITMNDLPPVQGMTY